MVIGSPGVTSKAEEVFNPIIERRTRAEKLRLTVALLERWKFFFNLPITLQQSIRKVGRSRVVAYLPSLM